MTSLTRNIDHELDVIETSFLPSDENSTRAPSRIDIDNVSEAWTDQENPSKANSPLNDDAHDPAEDSCNSNIENITSPADSEPPSATPGPSGQSDDATPGPSGQSDDQLNDDRPGNEPPHGLCSTTSSKLIEYMANTSAHGMPNIVAAVHITARVLWMISVLISFSLFLWQTSELVTLYLSNPVLVHKKVGKVYSQARV